MSLRVWLPLTKDLRNQGLDDVTVTNNGATFDANGKLGGCYSFDGSTSSINTNINIPNFALDKTYSITCWVCPSGTSGQKPIIGIGPDWSWTIFQQNTDLRFVQWDESGSRWGDPAISGVFSANTWVHIGVVWNQGVLLFYKNGEKIYEWTAPTSRTIKVSSDTVKIGGNIYAWGNNYFNGKLNDFRIYDHALSSMEIKQISQGLILHYPLNRNGWGQENLLKKSGFFKTFQGWTNNQSVTISIENNELKAIINQNTSTPGIKTTIPISLNAGIYTASLLIKVKNGGKDYVNFPFYMNNGSKVIYNGAYTKKEKRGEYIYEEATFTLSSNVENVIFYILSSGTLNGETWYIKNIKLELGQKATPWCPNSTDELYNTLGLNDNTQYDTSGYGNNGIKVGTFSYDSDTPKYNVSTVFNGSNTCIYLNDFILGNEWSYGMWFYHPTRNIGWTVITILNNTGSDADTQFSFWYHNNESRLQSTANTQYNSGIPTPTKDTWHHFFATFDGNILTTYIDGVVVNTKTITAGFTQKPHLSIGGRRSGENSWASYWKGKISDYKIYCTALSADDVKSLYQNSAYIDSQGNIYGAVYEEV